MKKGKIVFTLDNYLTEHNISKTKLMHGAEMQMTQLLKYWRNQIERADLDVLVRICNYLDCNLEDIMHYEKQQ
jgi:putative transcriptional regulator